MKPPNPTKSTRAALAALAALAAAVVGTAQTQSRLVPIRDNTLIASNTGAVSNAKGDVFVGVNAQGLTRRGLIAFDTGGIPRGAEILDASLSMRAQSIGGGNGDLSLYRVDASWGEGTSGPAGGGGAPATRGDATWVHRSWNTTRWAAAGGDFAATPSAATRASAANQRIGWRSTPRLVADVQRWVDVPYENHGWIIIGFEPVHATVRLASRESPTPSHRPELLLVWGPPRARVVATGSGCRGTNRLRLSLAANGVPRLGNATFGITVTNGPPAEFAALWFGFALASMPLPVGPTCAIYLETRIPPGLIHAMVPRLNGAGARNIPLPVPNDMSLIGGVSDCQLVAPDRRAPAGVVTSNALTLIYGR